MSARLFFVRCSQAECEFGVLILIKGVNGRCWLCFVLFTESYNRVCCKGPGMTCGGDGKATWMCNFVVKLSETYRVMWREGGGVLILGYYLHLEVCHLFPYNNFNFWLIRGGVVKYNLRPPPHPFPHLSPLVTPLPRIIANNPFFVTTLALFACQKLSFLFA